MYERTPTAALSSVWFLSIEFVGNKKANMIINRRQFLLLTAGLATGCQVVTQVGTAARAARQVNAGPIENYFNEGVYTNYRNLGFFVIRQGDKLFALSSVCTHRKCKLSAETDRSFYCKCHGSTFDPAGHVTHGPAKLDLPTLPAYTNRQGELVVTAFPAV
jgi:Rieske Fe-S protein